MSVPVKAASAAICPMCGSSLRDRQSKKGFKFWGCGAYPKCTYTRPMSQDELGYIKGDVQEIVKQGRPTYKPTAEQNRIIESVVNCSNKVHVQVVAGAGCAKTSTQVLAAWELFDVQPEAKILAVAYNSAIVKELQARMPSNVTSLSTHQYGKLIIQKIIGKPPRLNEDKLDRFIDKYYPLPKRVYGKLTQDEKSEIASIRQARTFVANLVSLFKAHVSCDNAMELIELQGIELPQRADVEKMIEHAKKCYAESIAVMDEIDFDDMLAIPASIIQKLIMNPTMRQYVDLPTFDYVFGDEAQDWNTAQHYLMLAASGMLDEDKFGRLLFVGDPRQAIYGFRGADYNSMSNLSQMICDILDQDVITLPLMRTMRCSKAVVAMANKIEPALIAHETNLIGSVTMLAGLDMESVIANPMHYMISCRTNRPLLELAYNLWKQRIPCRIQGRDFGAALRTMILNTGAETTKELIATLRTKIDREADKEKPDINSIDKMECLIHLAGDCDTVEQIKQVIDQLFNDRGEGVLLTTAHRSKGLEAENVICIPPHAPHPMAKSDMAQAQEHNLLYVQWTRAKNNLFIVADPKLPYAYSVK